MSADELSAIAAAPIKEGDPVFVVGGSTREAIRRAVEEEREACAQAVDALAESWKSSTAKVDPVQAFRVAANAIRARK